MVVPAFASVVRYHPAVNGIVLFRRKELGQLPKFPKAFSELLSGIRKARYDGVIDLQGLLRSAVISRLAKTRVVAGPAVSREWGTGIFYQRRLDPGDRFRHAVRKNLSMMAEFLGVPEPDKAEFEFKANPVAAQRVVTLLRGSAKEKLIAVAPGARWHSKQWPPEFFAETLNLFYRDHHDDYSFVILGSPDEKPLGEQLQKHLKAPAVNLIGLTGIPELVEAIRRSRLLFCNDSGPMHIAAALGTPLVCMFGPTDPVLTGPFPTGRKSLFRHWNALNVSVASVNGGSVTGQFPPGMQKNPQKNCSGSETALAIRRIPMYDMQEPINCKELAL